MRTTVRSGSIALAMAAVLVASGCSSDNGDETDNGPSAEGTPTDDATGSDPPEDEDEEAEDGAPTDDAPTPDPAEETDEEGLGDAGSDATEEELVASVEGVWRSEDDDNRVIGLADETVGLAYNGTECSGGHDRGPSIITLAVWCGDDDTPIVGNAVAEPGETLTIDWVGEDPETFTWIDDADDLLG